MEKAVLGIALAAHTMWLQGDPRGVRADLRGADLRGADLRGVNLCGVNLQGANLQYADLRGADLRGADLRGVNLCGVNLRGADLQGADLRDANLRCANLQGADLQYANLRGADLQGADLRGVNLQGANRIIGPRRSDGYLFMYCTADRLVYAGCRKMTLEEYRQHTLTYADQGKRDETTRILNYLKEIENALSSL